MSQEILFSAIPGTYILKHHAATAISWTDSVLGESVQRDSRSPFHDKQNQTKVKILW